ncbi:UNVERIFIED_CONTAM: hypothetical protein FKN15_052789, partial [Acipenser sinensis]
SLSQALMALFVLASKDGWVDIMYDGLDAVGVDQQPVMNYNPWMLLYFISFLLIVSFFVLNMFVGVVVENFHKCRKHQEAEEAKIREEKRLRRMEKKRRKAQCKPYYSDYSPSRLLIHKMCTSHYLDLFITVVIGLNVITMAMEHYQQPKVLDEALKICNYIFTIIFVLESVFKLVAFGFRRFFKERWNQLDLAIVLLSIMGITLEEIEVNASLPINPTIIRIMRVLRIARVCDDTHPCEGLGRHATFRNFGMAFLTLFRVSTGDNWNGIMKDTLRDCAQDTGTCYNTVVSPLYFVSFVLTAQFVLVNVVIAVLMKHLEESNKEAKEEAELEAELELELRSISNPAPVTEGLPWANLRTDSPDPAPGKGDSPLSLEPPLRRSLFDTVSLLLQGSMEGELTLMDNLSGSVCHHYALPLPGKCTSEKQIPLAEMEALSLTSDILSEKSWSLALTDDSVPDDINTLLLNTLESNVLTADQTTCHFDWRKIPLVQPPHHFLALFTSFLCSAYWTPPDPVIARIAFVVSAKELAPVLQGNLLSVRKPSVGRAHSLPNDSYMFQTLDPAASPKRDQSEQDSTSICSRGLCWVIQQSQVDNSSMVHILLYESTGSLALVAVINDSSETLYTESKEAAQPPQQNELSSAGLASPAVLLVPATPGASPALLRSSVHTQYNISSQPRPPGPRPRRNPFGGHPSLDPADQEVSHITASPALKKYHSVDAQAPQQRLLLARPSSWLDDPRRHSIEICSSVESSPQRSSGSSGFVSRAESFQLPSPHRKKKMSPPCISVEPPESQPSLPPLPGRDSCLRRRAPSCDSKDSVDLGGEAVPADGPPPAVCSAMTQGLVLMALPAARRVLEAGPAVLYRRCWSRLIFPPEIATSNLRPDIVLWFGSARLVHLVELTVPWKDAVDEAYERKKLWYAQLAAEAEQRGWGVRVYPVEMGCQGFVAHSTTQFLSPSCCSSLKQQRGAATEQREAATVVCAVLL